MLLTAKEMKDWLVVVITSFLVALVLMFLRLPNWIAVWIYPQWLVLAILYWIWVMPQRMSVSVVWLLGILLDILANVPVGEHALVLVVATYFITKFNTKIALLDFWKKIAVMCGIIIGCQLLPSIVQLVLGKQLHFWSIFSRAIVGAGMWLAIVFWFDRQHKIYFENYY